MKLVSTKFAFLLILFTSLFAATALAWEKIDYEIFELYDDIKRNEPTTDWYELLNVGHKASTSDINKAYRKLSMKYHPDKRRSSDKITAADEKRFQRIGLIVNILRDNYSRKRYNFFRKNGVPVWRGTGYLYNRWRPGLGSVLVGLALFVSSMQYLFHALSYWRAQDRIRIIEEDHKRTGGNITVRSSPQKANRKARRMMKQGKGSTPPSDYEDSGFEGEDIEPNQINTVGVINPYTVKPASIKRVVIVSLPVWMVKKSLNLIGLYKPSEDDASDEFDEEIDVPVNKEHTDDGRTGADILKAVADATIASQEALVNETDPETKAKKASNKAKKQEARRRRTRLV